MNFGVDGARNLFTLQERQKWATKERNGRINDIVLLKEDAPRNQWPLFKIFKTNPDDQVIVMSMTLLLGIDGNNNRERILERPISKMILILEANDMDSPMKGDWHSIKIMNHLSGSQLLLLLNLLIPCFELW